MQILLRSYEGRQYVWVQAKYDKGKFIVNGNEQRETNVVSIVNDNRKNYVQCSSCGKVFRKGDAKFDIHKEDATSTKVCLNCPHVCASHERTIRRKYVINADGTYRRQTEQSVDLVCSKGFMWSYPDINSALAIENCKLRQCGNAIAKEIQDIFTQYPGIFDDIITADRILDTGYVDVPEYSYYFTVYALSDKYDIKAYVNDLSIVDCFQIYFEGDSQCVWYSKKYDEIFMEGTGACYTPWTCRRLTTQQRMEIKEIFAKLYR